MTFVVITFLYPLLLGGLSLGTGLLIERVSGAVLPPVLVPVAGFCALIVFAQFLVIRGATAPATPWVLVAVALSGFVLGRRALAERRRRLSWSSGWPVVAAALVYVTVASPLIAAGRLTFPGYLLDTTAGIHLATAVYVLQHGMQFPVPYPAYGAMLHAYDGTGYPDGGQVLLGATGLISGQSLVWLYFPFQVFAVAMTGLGLYQMARFSGLSRWTAAVAGWISAVPALVTAYALMGSIKELTALPAFLLLAAYLVLAARREIRTARAVVPFAVGCAAAIAAIGPAAAPWVFLLALAAVGAGLLPRPHGGSLRSQLRRQASALRDTKGLRTAATTVGAGIGLVVILTAPTLLRLQSEIATAASLAGSNSVAANDPGNLVRPLRFVQVFGVWLGSDHRYPPKYPLQTYMLIGVVIVGFAAGIHHLVRRRMWPLILWLGVSLVIWLVLYERGTEWTDAKVMMLTSPVILLVAMIGGLGTLRRMGLVGALLALVTAGGVLASDALLYHGTNLAPAARFAELGKIGKRFAGQGPAVVTDFDEYSFFELPKLRIDGPAFAPDMRGPFVVNGSRGVGYGLSYDPDNIASDLQRFRLIVMRRSPRWSRPPGNFRLVYSGRWYQVWKRTGPAPLMHLSLGANADPFGSATNPIGRPACSTVRTLAKAARAHHAPIRFATRPAPLIANLQASAHSPSVVPGTNSEGGPDLIFSGPGVIQTRVRVPQSGIYELWLGGNIGNRTLRATVDGKVIGSASDQLAGDGNMTEIARVALTAGRHIVTITRGGGGLAPGNGSPTMIDGIYLARGLNTTDRITRIAPSAWHSLCGRRLDWIEVM